ncbi:hypothetical protein PPAR_a1186 [Pseudoalteromonas paragorgicola KMM 3548]|nr:hypothetical protein [Pseudoalteromonas distincta KMM 3548]
MSEAKPNDKISNQVIPILCIIEWLYQSAIILNHFAGLNVSLPTLKNSHLEQLNSEFFA